MNRSLRQAMIDRGHKQLSLVRQCTLLNISRASVYYRPVSTRAEDLELMARMDRQYLKTPFYGSRKMKAWLLAEGYLNQSQGGNYILERWQRHGRCKHQCVGSGL